LYGRTTGALWAQGRKFQLELPPVRIDHDNRTTTTTPTTTITITTTTTIMFLWLVSTGCLALILQGKGRNNEKVRMPWRPDLGLPGFGDDVDDG
jgi:hypothetical protein